MIDPLVLEQRPTNSPERLSARFGWPESTEASFELRDWVSSSSERTDALYIQNLSKIVFQNAKVRAASLLDEWVAETGWMSSTSSMKAHPAFATLISIGAPAVASIIERLQDGDVHVHWFPVLKAVTAADPVPLEERGKTKAMAGRWIVWADQNLD